ncbi:hypothetical protein K439DRAFT_1614287 [Ramaria rubella]|nr:hypothetical protein K439DRAFT_1614287 [Ramaria rubella]
MCKRSQGWDKWIEVLNLVQQNSDCLGHDWETVCNKFKSLLKMVGKAPSKSMFPRSTLGHGLDSDSHMFTVLLGHLDAMAALKTHAEQIQAQDTKAKHGQVIHDAMVVGHAWKSKCQYPAANSDNSDKENSFPPLNAPLSASQTEVRTQLSAKCCWEQGFNKIVTMLQSSLETQECFQDCQNAASEALIAAHQEANEEVCLGCEEMKALQDEM